MYRRRREPGGPRKKKHGSCFLHRETEEREGEAEYPNFVDTGHSVDFPPEGWGRGAGENLRGGPFSTVGREKRKKERKSREGLRSSCPELLASKKEEREGGVLRPT